jgi:hypothetical protein
LEEAMRGTQRIRLNGIKHHREGINMVRFAEDIAIIKEKGKFKGH